MPVKFSNCCGSEGKKEWYGSGMPYRDFDVCDKCGEHCEYVEDADDTPDDLFSRMAIFNPQTNKETIDRITQKIKS